MALNCIGKFKTRDGEIHLASPMPSGNVLLLSSQLDGRPRIALDSVLHSTDPLAELEKLQSVATKEVCEGDWVSPVCRQEIWAVE